MSRYQRARRKATLISALAATGLYTLIIFLPAIAGYITAEQPAPAVSSR